MKSLALLFLLFQTVDRPVRSVSDPGVVTTRQTISPAGVPTVFLGRTFGVAFSETAAGVWVLHESRIYHLDWRENRILASIPHSLSPGLQSAAFANGRFLAAGSERTGKRQVRLALTSYGSLNLLGEGLGTQLSGGLAVANDKPLVTVPLTFDNKVAILDFATGNLLGSVPTGIAPFGSAINRAGTVAYVSNWGGRRPGAKDKTAPTGLSPSADQVVVDERGIASTGSVTAIDLTRMEATHTIPAGRQSTAIALDEDHQRLYVANGNEDSITIVDTAAKKVLRTVPLRPFAEAPFGLAPTALALSKDRLYIALGGINAVAVFDPRTDKIEGLIPTAWYPNSLALSPDGKYLAISALLGVGSGWRDAPNRRFVHSNRGAVHVVELPDAAQLASFTTAVAENNHLHLPGTTLPRRASIETTRRAIPRRAGEPSLIENVVYIVKENRTYDQVLGDLERGNGDPTLVMFGRDVTPNQHRLAEQFTTLDNFYATGGNSANGHQWVTQANETAYTLWPGYAGRSYPYDGTDPIAYSNGGFLWDAALNRGRTVRMYGEYAGRLPVPAAQRIPLLERWKSGADFSQEWSITAPLAPLNRILAHHYPSYTTAIPDVIRARIFLKDLKQWEQDGKMPHLVFLQLPSNHTYGTLPGVSTPKAMVADNDLALGQVVEALSKSKFWPKMAIFVVEDDAQNGVDHVDGHRTVALAVSPFTRRGAVDSTFYSHQSILKTIELILGLPALSLFDLIANDMRASFQDIPDLTPYESTVPTQDLFELNPKASALKGDARRAAIASARFRWDVPDAAPPARLNRILWGQIRGWNTPYPGARHAVFAPLSLDDDEE